MLTAEEVTSSKVARASVGVEALDGVTARAGDRALLLPSDAAKTTGACADEAQVDPPRRFYPPYIEAEDQPHHELDKGGRAFWLVALVIGPLTNAALGWTLIVAGGNYAAVPVVEPVLIGIEVLILLRLSVAAGVPTRRRRVVLVRDGVLVLLFATMVAVALGYLLTLYMSPAPESG